MSVLPMTWRLPLALMVTMVLALAGCTADADLDPSEMTDDTPYCTNTCQFAGDGECDDGGAGSVSALCGSGTDCQDCGSRAPLCSNTCSSASDGECDDGGPGAAFGICELGTDCDDCGSRSSDDVSQPPTTPPDTSECPEGCAAGEVCVTDQGCLLLCEAADECATGCCYPLMSGDSVCVDSSYCDSPTPPDPGGTPTTLDSTTPTSSIPTTDTCTGDAASASGELDAVNTPLFAGSTEVDSFSVRYDMSTIFGEPTRSAAYAWQGTGTLGSVVWAAEVMTQDGAFQYVTDTGQRVYASYPGGTIGDAGEGFGFDVSASPSWDQTFVLWDGSGLVDGVSEDEAKRIYRGCFRLGALRLLEINGDPALHP